MIAYLDTHIVQWFMQGNIKQLSRNARRLIDAADLLISPMVTLELEMLYEIKRAPRPWHDIQSKLRQEIGLRVCDLSFDMVISAALYEGWTRDPFDRIIVANAKANGLAYLISADEDIRKNYQRAVW